MARLLSIAAGTLVVLTLAAFFSLLACTVPTRPFDEPLWFMRSRVSPADLSTSRYVSWAIDIPAANRWVYYAVLKATGLDKVPPDEPQCWSLGPDYIRFQGFAVKVTWKSPSFKSLEHWESQVGRYAPRRAILAMRTANVAFYFVTALCLWLAARMALESGWLSLVCVSPLFLSANFSASIAYEATSGDVFLAAGLAATLAVWMRFHLAGKGVSWPSVILVSALSGLTTSAKHPGVLVVLAVMAYFAWQSRGWARVWRPAAAAVIALAAFAAVNPVVMFSPNESLIEVLAGMARRRARVNTFQMLQVGELQPAEALNLFWWPLLPAYACAFRAARKEPWFPPLALWSGFLAAGMVAALFSFKVATPRYLAPLEMGLFFPLGVAALAIVAGKGRGSGPGRRRAGTGQAPLPGA